MTASFDIRDMSPEDFAAKLEMLPEILNVKLEGAARDIGQRIRGDAADGAPVDTGQLASSIEAVVKNVGKTITEIRVGSNNDAAAPQEFGTEPHFPPVSALRPWARRVLGDASAAYPVAQSIAESGLDAQPYLRPAFEDNVEFVLDRINRAVRESFGEVGLV
jgi:Bacteriophage protein of unknown function (DUF646).